MKKQSLKPRLFEIAPVWAGMFTNWPFVFFIPLLIFTFTAAQAQRISRDLNVDILINQAGYHPASGKICVVKGETSGNFEVINTETQEVVFQGSLSRHPEISGIT
jgi:hypothetical protein